MTNYMKIKLINIIPLQSVYSFRENTKPCSVASVTQYSKCVKCNKLKVAVYYVHKIRQSNN